MVLEQDNCLKLEYDNHFGIRLNEIVANPTQDNKFYAVGYHYDYSSEVSTAVIVELELHTTYLMTVSNFQTLNSDFSVAGTTMGWTSINFNSNNQNIILSGLIQDQSQIYCSILSVDTNLTTFNWMKYFNQTSGSTLNLNLEKIDAHYDSNSDSVLVMITSINNSTSYYNMINIFRLDATSGSTDWSIQFRDYSGTNFGYVRSVVNPSYNELVLFYTNHEFDYYHAQAINIDDGSLLNNVQIEMFKHYVINGIVVFPDQTLESNITDILMTAQDGYIMKVNTRKANLAILDSDSWDRPLCNINYDNFTLPLETNIDLEVLSYTPSSDFFVKEVNFEVFSYNYSYYNESIPTISDATDMAIYFEDTTKVVNSPNAGNLVLSQPKTKGSLRDDLITVTFVLYDHNK